MDPVEHRQAWQRFVDFPLVTLVIATAVFALALGAAIVVGSALPPVDPLLSLFVRSVLAILMALLSYKLIIAHLGEVHRDELPFAAALREAGAGAALGFGLFAIIVAMAAILDVYNIVGAGSLAQLPNMLLAAVIVPAILEEIFFRGILFRWAEEFAGSWAGLALSSAAFGAAHYFNPSSSFLSSLLIAVEAGTLLGGAYMLTRSLWMPIGLHAAWNFTQGFVFDVPVSGVDSQGIVEARLSGPPILSGGEFGLEASVLALIVATVAGIYLVRRAIREGQLVRPWWVRRNSARQELPIA